MEWLVASSTRRTWASVFDSTRGLLIFLALVIVAEVKVGSARRQMTIGVPTPWSEPDQA